MAPSDRTWGSRDTPKPRRFCLNIRKHPLCCEGDQLLTQAAQGGCRVPTLKSYWKATWTQSWATSCKWPCLVMGPDDIQRSLQPQPFCNWYWGLNAFRMWSPSIWLEGTGAKGGDLPLKSWELMFCCIESLYGQWHRKKVTPMSQESVRELHIP